MHHYYNSILANIHKKIQKNSGFPIIKGEFINLDLHTKVYLLNRKGKFKASLIEIRNDDDPLFVFSVIEFEKAMVGDQELYLEKSIGKRFFHKLSDYYKHWMTYKLNDFKN